MGARSGSSVKSSGKDKKKGLFSRFRKQKKEVPPPPPPSAPHFSSKAKSVQIASNPTTTPAAAAAPKKLKKPGNFLCRTQWFQDMCKTSFAVVDQDGSGSVDQTELYSGLLLIHLKLGTYAGPAACRPLDREKCNAVFLKMDVDGSGSLDQDEFAHVMMVLFSNVLLRVVAQWSLTLLIVPLVAQYILDGILAVIQFCTDFVADLDEHAELFNQTEIMIEHAWEVVLEKTPPQVLTAASKVGDLLDQVPASVWNTIPLTLLSTLLGILVVPWVIMKIDDTFQSVADRKKAETLKSD